MKHCTLVASFALAALAVVGLVPSAAASPLNPAPPDEPGPFNVGVTTFSAMMSDNRLTQIQVFYPTNNPRRLSVPVHDSDAGGLVSTRFAVRGGS